jgi:hypothetical protein
VINWPSGQQQVLQRPPIDRFNTVVEPAR